MTARYMLWDYGNVLVHWSPRALYQKLIPEPDRLDWFLENVCTLDWHHQHDQGRPMAETIPELQAEFPEFAEEIAAWEIHFGAMIGGEIATAVAVCDQLEVAGVPQYVLTNMPSEVVDICFDAFPRPERFSDIIVSGREKVAKPDRAAFDLTLARMGNRPAEEVFFVDDSVANIETAATMGFKTYHFTGGADLLAAVRAAGLLP